MRCLSCFLNRWFLAGLVGLLVSAANADGVLHPGHSSHWFVPERSGEGWVLEILDDQRALVYWFTYDEVGNQRWLIGEGAIGEDDNGWYIAFPDMYVTRGPEFGPDFNPSSLTVNVVGDGVMRFTDCDHGLFEFEGLGQELAFPIQRLTRTMGADCSAPLHGRPGEPLQPYGGQSGSWYDPASSGQGMVLQWMAGGTAVLTWFTYDADGDQQWMIGVGHRQNDQVVFSDLHATRGGLFGEAFDSEVVEQIDWGELELQLDCNGGQARFESNLPEFGGGELALVRLTALMRPEGCPALPPQLTELFDIDYLELPVMNPGEEPRTQVSQIAGDGTVVGSYPGPFGESTIFRVLRPDESDWLDIEEDGFSTAVVLSGDGEWASFNVLDGWTDSGAARFETKLWREEIGAQPLSGQILGSSFVLAGSYSGSCLVGTGRIEPGGSEQRWKWSTDEGQQLLPEQDSVGGGTPTGCSEDGRIVIGNRPLGKTGTRQDIAMRWVGDAKPTFLYDSRDTRLRFAQACSADCSAIVGGDQVDLDQEHPHYREPWLWTEELGARYLGMPEDAILIGLAPVTAWDITSDGSFVVGSYAVVNSWDGSTGSRAFIWAERTGQLIVSELLAKVGLGDENWQRMSAISVAEGEDGIRILLSGEYRDPPDSWTYARRAAILHVAPSRTEWFE
jgi:hypothetical protein